MNCASGLYRAFFNSVSDPIFVIDAATKTIVEANAQAVKYFGYRPEELKGFCIDRLFRKQNDLGLLFFLQKNGSKTHCDSLELLKKDGEPITVNVSTTWVEWGSTKYLFVIAHEIEAALPCNRATDNGDAAWQEPTDFLTIVGQSEKIQNVCRCIGSVAKSEVTVLIQGESGTGKEIVANAIHAHSHRRQGSFVKVNCAALTETLLESELFGHVKGAFTGAIRDRRGRFKQADGGTILLDEIGSMSLSGQAKLLRVLQERKFEPVGSSVTTSVNVRVIASTISIWQKPLLKADFARICITGSMCF
jgi:PAS domain S-box-containing protein